MIKGLDLDSASRCPHYHTERDILGLKCFSCASYYACYLCHDACENHSFKAYPRDLDQDKVAICGLCHYEMTIAEYESCKQCPSCLGTFNPKCRLHKAIYFE
ncbi:CHY zinc finger protein [Streptococcus loxodontisalivarius]|uniref:CHY zinc finger protein n=1 Tax=Streptococcus loxodontisalivarius TaxID=1349415 RepID=UPI001962147F|nr:CHY zinc finger protein [Streptococcus loxodontisalivarius]